MGSHMGADLDDRGEMSVRLTAEARQLLHHQRGMIACWQAASVGLTSRALRAAPRGSGDWRWVGYRTLTAGSGPLTQSQLRVVALLEVGPAATLAGLAALQEAGWQGDSEWVDVLVPRGNPYPRKLVPTDVRAHSTTAYPAPNGLVPRSRPARAVVDAAAWASSEREAIFVAISAIQARQVSPTALSRELHKRPNLKRSGVLAEVLAEFLAEFLNGTHSLGELDFVRECRRRRLPKPQQQVRRRDASGKVRFSDVEFLRGDGRLVTVEIDGIGHLAPEVWLADMDRHNDLAITSESVVLRVSAWAIRHDPDPFFAKLQRVLDAGHSPSHGI